MRADLNVVLLLFGSAHQESALGLLREFVGKNFSGASARYLLVDNSVSGGMEERLAPDTTRIAGDNESWEFSGYDAGVRWYERSCQVGRSTTFLIANDTFHRSYGMEYLWRFTRGEIARAESESGILGYVDSYPRPVKLCNYTFQSWIRSSFFILPYPAVKMVQPFSLQLPRDEVFGRWPPAFFRAGVPLSENYQRYIRTWLFEDPAPDSEFPFEWHSKKPLTEETYHECVRKAWCILCEHMLSARADSLGIPLIPAGGPPAPHAKTRRTKRYLGVFQRWASRLSAR